MFVDADANLVILADVIAQKTVFAIVDAEHVVLLNVMDVTIARRVVFVQVTK